MKKIFFYIMTASFLSFYTISCDDFLERPPVSDVTLDEIFGSYELATRAMVKCYENLPFLLPSNAGLNPANRPNTGVGRVTLDNLTDLVTARFAQQNGANGYYYSGSYSSTIEMDAAHFVKYSYTHEKQWLAIRRCWTIIEQIDKVPDMENAEKEQYKAEARVIIAIHYLEMLRHLGGVPKVTATYTANDDFNTERMTIREMIDWISELIDDAYEKLPYKYANSNMYGRITRVGALAVKARMLHFVASPLFNDVQPYMPGEASDKLYTWLGSKDNSLWKSAVDACEQVITEALSNGYGLVQPVTQDLTGYRAAYQRAYHAPDNGEQLIITRLPGNPLYPQGQHGGPSFLSHFNNGAFIATQNWAFMFPMANGYDIDPSQPNYNAANGFDDQYPNRNRDPRFYESFTTNLGRWGTGSPGIARMWHGGADRHPQGNIYGAIAQKFIIGGRGQNTEAALKPLIFPYIRLAEIYLNYAEAVNQYEGSTPAQRNLALQRVNEVRGRVGLPGLPAGMDKEKFHDAIMKERCCEFGFEGVRWFDIIRWKMEDVFKVQLRGMNSWLWLDIAEIPGFSEAGIPTGNRSNSYGATLPGVANNDNAPVLLRGDGIVGTSGKTYVRLPATLVANDPRPTANTMFDPNKHVITYYYYDLPEVDTRAWKTNFSPKWYLSAFPLDEVNKDYGLVQNPGW